MQTKDLAKRLGRTQPLYIFRGYSNPTDCAQDQLQGRTHYADPSTLRFFHARILSARPVFDGLFYWIMESCALDPDNESRGYRAVLFDLFGETVFRPDFEGCRKTRSAAETDYQAWANTFDPVAHYRQAVAARADRLNRTAEQLRGIFDMVEA